MAKFKVGQSVIVGNQILFSDDAIRRTFLGKTYVIEEVTKYYGEIYTYRLKGWWFIESWLKLANEFENEED